MKTSELLSYFDQDDYDSTYDIAYYSRKNDDFVLIVDSERYGLQAAGFINVNNNDGSILVFASDQNYDPIIDAWMSTEELGRDVETDHPVEVYVKRK